jgi:hypothetical protein
MRLKQKYKISQPGRAQDKFNAEFFQIFKDELKPMLFRLSHKIKREGILQTFL